MPDTDLDKLKDALAKASLGDWLTTDDAAHPDNTRIKSKYRSHIAKVYASGLGDKQGKVNAAAIVLLHNAAPALIAELEAARAKIGRLEGEVARLSHEADRAWRERNIAVAKVKGWEQVLCIEGLPSCAVQVNEWGASEGEQVVIPDITPRKLTALLDELAAARAALKETTDDR